MVLGTRKTETVWQKIKPIKCPKCRKSSDIRWVSEIYETEHYFDIEGHKRDAEGWFGEPNSTGRLEVKCGCGHYWRLRNAIQITCLDEQE